MPTAPTRAPTLWRGARGAAGWAAGVARARRPPPRRAETTARTPVDLDRLGRLGVVVHARGSLPGQRDLATGAECTRLRPACVGNCQRDDTVPPSAVPGGWRPPGT